MAFLGEQNYSKSTIARKLATLRSFYKFCVRRNYVKANPLVSIRMPKQEKRLPKFLNVADVEKLLQVLHRLVDSGNTVIVIEHNLDVVKTADHIIDLGPEGGERGGYIVAQGTPEEVAAVTESATGAYLARALKGEPVLPLSDISFSAGGNGRSGHSPRASKPRGGGRRRAPAAAP